MRALVVALLFALVAPAHAGVDRAVIRAHQAERARLRAQLHAASGPNEHAAPVLYHQVRDKVAQAELVAEVEKGVTHKMLSAWIPRGGYPGIWTVEDAEGFFRTTAGRPFELRLKEGSVLFDPDKSEHRAVYEAWKKLDEKTRGPGARNRFDEMKGADGRALSTRVGGVHAPSHERFYKEMGIAGVGWWLDAYGQRSVIVLNPHAVASVKVPPG